jgi:capsular exopolysaccharide synthesis family protein
MSTKPRDLAVQTPGAGEPPQELGRGPSGYWQTVGRHKGSVLLSAFLGVLGACLYTFPQTPLYRARAILEWQGLNENFLNMRDVNPMTDAGNAYNPEYDIQTQVRILVSRSLTDRVAAKLDLDHRPLVVNRGRLASWSRSLGITHADPTAEREAALETAAKNLSVRAQPSTRLIMISCDSTDSRLAADFVNTLVQEYTEQNLESRWKATQKTGDWLGRQMEDVKIKLEKSDESLQDYARASGLLFTSEKDNVAEERLRQLQEELSKAQADRVTKQSRFETASSAAPDSLAEVLDDGTLRDYQSKLTELRRQLAELSPSFTPQYPRVKRVEAQVAALEGSLEKERSNIVRRIRNDFEEARRREQLLEADYAGQARLVSEQAEKVTHYQTLKREVDINRQLYESMLQRVKEAGVASALRASNVRVVDPARPPKAPYRPDIAMNSLAGMLMGLLAGAAVVVIRDRGDRSLREPGDAQLYLNVPELGVIPNLQTGRLSRFRPGAAVKDLALATWEPHPSDGAEYFRAVLASVLFAGQPRVIALSSPNPGEGKTTVAANLAIALAETHQRVLLIDGDLRAPGLHEVFGLDNSIGLATILRGDTSACAPDSLLKATRIPGLHVLPSGCSPESAPALLHSPHFAEFLEAARPQFDTILIDTPPVLPMPDARVFGRLAGAVILVVRANKTSRDTAALACRRFIEDGTPVLGTILNECGAARL